MSSRAGLRARDSARGEAALQSSWRPRRASRREMEAADCSKDYPPNYRETVAPSKFDATVWVTRAHDIDAGAAAHPRCRPPYGWIPLPGHQPPLEPAVTGRTAVCPSARTIAADQGGAFLERGGIWRGPRQGTAERWRLADGAPRKEARAVRVGEAVPGLVALTRCRVGGRRRSIGTGRVAPQRRGRIGWRRWHQHHLAASAAAGGAHSTRVGLARSARVCHAALLVPHAVGGDTTAAD